MIRAIYPEGNEDVYIFDDENPDLLQRGNLIEKKSVADANRGGDQEFISTRYTFEPIYNQIRSAIEPRGNDSSFQPQNGGEASPARYTSINIFDYQEGVEYSSLAERLGLTEDEVRAMLDLIGIPMGLGDLNGDGVTNQINGNVVQIRYPSVHLMEACPSSELTALNSNCSIQARLEADSLQEVVETFQYNEFGQIVQNVDPEGNVTVYRYHPENDPDGDGQNLSSNIGNGPFGYLRSELYDVNSDIQRNSGTNPDPTNIQFTYFYDSVGNVIREIDGRGIATDYVVNQLNQVVEEIRAAEVSQALGNPEEPNWEGCVLAGLVECSDGMEPFGISDAILF